MMRRKIGNNKALKQIKRTERGALTSVFLIVLLLVSLGVSSLALDFSHGVMVKAQLQSAVDAGALAGAQELTTLTPTASNISNAQGIAESVTGKNTVENVSVSSASPGVTVTVVVDGTSMPRTFPVTATKTVSNIFARIFGASAEPVTSRSIAGAWYGIKSINPGQAYPLVVSLDWSPPSGPQQGKPLNSYVGPQMAGQTFTIDLNSQQAKEGAWIKGWSGTLSPTLTFGTTPVQLQNGVEANLVAPLVGDTLIIPLVQGGPPFNDQRTVIGAIGFKVTSLHFPQQITGNIIDPIYISGQPGYQQQLTSSSQSNLFLAQTNPWQVTLLQ